MTKFRLYFYCFLSTFALSCAQVVSPSGGERDHQPPLPLSMDPPNESTDFNASSIQIEFDEFIQLNQFEQQLIVSPPLKYKLQTKIKGKSLTIEIKDTLKSNTTYVMNFGESIQDITENNPIPNFQYVFATGRQIDSLRIRGKVLDAFSREVEENATVMLHQATEDDSVFYQKLPNYISRTDKEGNFSFSNLAEGTYRLFALQDANQNYIYDRADEKIAFQNEQLILNKDTAKLFLFSFLEETEKQFIENQIWKDNQLILRFKKPVDKLEFTFLDTNAKDLVIDYRLTPQKDSAFFWFKEIDDQRLSFLIQDDSTALSDTLKLKFDSISRLKTLKANDLPPKIPHHKTLHLDFNRPIENFDSTRIILLDSDSIKVDFSLEIDSVLKHRLYLSFKMKPDSSYGLQLLPGSVSDVFSRKLRDSLNYHFTVDQPSDYGSLSVKIKNTPSETPFIIQLTDASGKVLRSKRGKEAFAKFDFLRAGTYRIKLILDNNQNGRWDAGNYLKEIQAEKTYLYDENIQIRSNWDKEIDWIIQSF